MSLRNRCSWLVVASAGFSLLLSASGCQVSLTFGDKDNKQPAPKQSTPTDTPAGPAIQQTAYPGQTPATPPPGSAPAGPVLPAVQGCGPGGCGAGGCGAGGCGGAGDESSGPVPTEKAKTSLPPYIIEPPDILLLAPIRLIPKPPYTVGPLDVLLVRVAQTLPNQPIEGTYTISPDGAINLGYSYGLVRVGGLTLTDVEKVVRAQLVRAGLREPQVAIGLAQFRGVQQTRGEHLVRQDGTIHLGSYGCVYVAGLTLNQAKVAIERHLSQYLQDPEISVDVGVYNSKAYYVITDGAGYGESVFRLPVTGNETVLDAISQIRGLPAVASTKNIWVARPGPSTLTCSQILPVDWHAITQAGVTATNYQIFPGDRIYVKSDCLINFDNQLGKLLAPVERVLGFSLLGATTYSTIRNAGNNNNNGGGAAFIAPLR